MIAPGSVSASLSRTPGHRGAAAACGAAGSVEGGYLDDEQRQFSVAFRRNHVHDSQLPAPALRDHLAWSDVCPCERDLTESIAVGGVDQSEAKHGRGA